MCFQCEKNNESCPRDLHNSFKKFFEKENVKKELDLIKCKLLNNEKYDRQFYPYPQDVLRFATLDLSKVICIILGMDPYPSDFSNEGKVIPVATGRSFEVKNLLSWQDSFKQTSLQKILKTLYYNDFCNGKLDNKNNYYNKNLVLQAKISDIRMDIKNNIFKIAPPPELWDKLEGQGVMWLNATLTVKPNVSNSHTTLWQNFIDELIKYILEYKKEHNEKNVKWLVWGESAKNRIENLVDNKDIIYSCHPASRKNNNFVEDNCFKNIKEINWTCR